MENLFLGAIGAAVGGGIAFGIWSILPDAWRASRVPVSIVAAVLCGVPATNLELPPPEPTPAMIERTMLEHPDLGELMTAWKETDPTTFAEFIEFAGRHSDGGYSEVRSDPHYAAMMARVGRRLAYLSDADALERFMVARDQMLELRLSHPELCQGMFNNRGVDLSDPPFSRELHRRFLAIQARALRSAPENAVQPMTADEVRATMQDVSARTQAVVGDDITLLSPDAAVTGHETRFCEVAAEYFNQMSQSREIARLNAGLVVLQHGAQ